MLTMVIDDSRAMRLILKRIVAQLGFDVVEAGNGQEAMDYLKANVLDGDGEIPGLALVDWNMPEMNGLEFVQAARADVAYRDVRIVMVTTETEIERVFSALEAGADEYLMKPFNQAALNDKLELLGVGAGS